MSPAVLIVPGLRDRAPAHWQTQWQLRNPEFVRVLQRDWNAPRLDEWTASLDRAIRAAGRRVILVAHSFGCLAAIQRVAAKNDDVAGALLVAPADPLKFRLEGQLPAQKLAVPSILVGSCNDPCLDFSKAADLAKRLGAAFVNGGVAGHINAEPGYGPWPEGEQLLERLKAQIAARERALRVALAAA